MRFIKANPNEYLIIGRRGRIINRGVAASALLLPGSTYALIPSTQQEATFEMTQETKDGIPLRFKGVAVYRVTAPEAAAKLFNFATGSGHEQIKGLISHICLGELRSIVSHMTMEECIEQRKTVLSEKVAAALKDVISGSQDGQGWGIELDVLQVAQVFIVDQELRKQLEAELRNEIRSRSEKSDIQTNEQLTLARTVAQRRIQQDTLEVEKKKIEIDQELSLARTASKRRLQQEELEVQREKIEIEREETQLKKNLERDWIEADTPVRLLRVERNNQVLKQELELRRLENQVQELEVAKEMIRERAMHELRKEMLPLEQAPELVKAASKVFQGTNLSVYGDASPLVSALVPIIDLLGNAVRDIGLRKPVGPVGGTASRE